MIRFFPVSLFSILFVTISYAQTDRLENGAACFALAIAQQAAVWREYSIDAAPSGGDVTFWISNAKRTCTNLRYIFEDGQLETLSKMVPVWIHEFIPAFDPKILQRAEPSHSNSRSNHSTTSSQ